AETLIGAERIRESSFLVLHDPALGSGLVVTRDSLQKGRFCRPHRFLPRLIEMLEGRVDGGELQGGLADFVDSEGGETQPLRAGDRAILLPLSNGEKTWGGWVLELAAAEGKDAGSDLAALTPLAAIAGMVFGHVFHNQLSEEQRRQTQDLHEA